MLRNFFYTIALVLAVGVTGCAEKSEEKQSTDTAQKTAGDTKKPSTTSPPKSAVRDSSEPDHVAVQHILIGFQGSVRGKNITRSQDEAKKLGNDVYEMAKSGEDFNELVKKYTDDAPPGIYRIANHGLPGDMSPTELHRKVFPRTGMVRAFGDTGFKLAVGEIGLAEHDRVTSPFGWHIIKRVE